MKVIITPEALELIKASRDLENATFVQDRENKELEAIYDGNPFQLIKRIEAKDPTAEPILEQLRRVFVAERKCGEAQSRLDGLLDTHARPHHGYDKALRLILDPQSEAPITWRTE